MILQNKTVLDKNRKDSKYCGLLFDIDIIPPTKKEIEETEIHLTKELATFLVDRLKKEVPEIINYTDFFGEAENYLRLTNKPWVLRKQVAIVMYNNFLSALDESAYYDTTEHCICLAKKYISSFDYGDYYSPAYEIIRKLMDSWIKEGNKIATNKIKK